MSNKKSQNKIIKRYSFLIGIAILLIIILKIDLNKLFSIIYEIKINPLLFGLLLTLPLILIKSYRWNYLKKNQNINYSVKNSFLIYWATMALGIATPGKVGEILKISYLKKDGYPYSKSLVNVIWDRLFDVLILAIMAFLFLLIFFRINIYLYSLIIILLLISIIWLIKKGVIKIIVRKLLFLLIPKKYIIKWQTSFEIFWQEAKQYNLNNYLFCLFLTILGWLIYFIQVIFFGMSLSLEIPYIYLIGAVVISALITTLPISYLGLGTREATFLILLSTFTAQTESLILLSELILLDYILIGIIGGIIVIFKPIPINYKNE